VAETPREHIRRVERWSFANALGMLVATGVAGWAWSLWPLLVVGGSLLGVLVAGSWRQWTPDGAFGAANTITALRTAGLAVVPAVAGSPEGLVGLGSGLLLADGADGWLARRRDRTSTFGAFFDKEADALFLLVLCAAAVTQGHVPVWVIGAGLLRYTFVLTVFGLDLPEKTEQRFSLARYIYAAMVGALFLSFLIDPAWARPLVGLTTIALMASFGRSLWQMMCRAASAAERPAS
jgi:phosphatidylglycerophosphate synthase